MNINEEALDQGLDWVLCPSDSFLGLCMVTTLFKDGQFLSTHRPSWLWSPGAFLHFPDTLLVSGLALGGYFSFLRTASMLPFSSFLAKSATFGFCWLQYIPADITQNWKIRRKLSTQPLRWILAWLWGPGLQSWLHYLLAVWLCLWGRSWLSIGLLILKMFHKYIPNALCDKQRPS